MGETVPDGLQLGNEKKRSSLLAWGYMAKLEWEWVVGGEVVRGTLDAPANLESVFVGPRLVSRSAPGGKPEGHTVPLQAGGDARVYFNATTRECVLYLDGAPVPPVRAGVKGGSSSASILIGVVVVGLVVMVISAVLAVYGVRKYLADSNAAQASAPLSQKYDGPMGLLVAHYPADFAAQMRGEYSLQLMRSPRDDSILLIALDEPVSSDPVELSRVALKPIIDALAAKGNADTARTGSGKCLGRTGYVTEGTANVGLEDVITWSCTFVENGHGYVFFASVNKLFAEADRPLMQRIIDATEIAAGAGPAPSSSPARPVSPSRARSAKP
jgi:hypothetical protein